MSAIDFTGLVRPGYDRFNLPLEMSTRLAARALLLALARSDHVYAAVEAAAIVDFCGKAFGLSESQRQDLLLPVKNLIEEPSSVEQACRLLREDHRTARSRCEATGYRDPIRRSLVRRSRRISEFRSSSRSPSTSTLGEVVRVPPASDPAHDTNAYGNLKQRRVDLSNRVHAAHYR